jgi:hypothetical protein
MKNKKLRKATQSSARKWKKRPVPVQAVDNAALEDIKRLWQRTEQAMQQPLSVEEQAVVAKVRSLLFTLAQDIGGQSRPPLTDAQTAKFRQELDRLFRRPPFGSLEKPNGQTK